MKEESATLSALIDSSTSCGETTTDSEILRKYSFGRRIPRNQTVVTDHALNKRKSKLYVKSDPSESSNDLEMQSPIQIKQVPESEGDKVKSISKRKLDSSSEAAILRSVLRPQGVPVPVDKVGIVREPQVIVRKFNIPMLCSTNSPKFAKLKERWKYQHDVVGLTNVNPTNPLHSIMKSKPVVQFSVASFVNDSTASDPTCTSSTILPKNHVVASNHLPVFSASPSVSVIPTSLPSAPTAVVKPVQFLKAPALGVGSLEAGKYLLLKAVETGECPSDVDNESETVSAVNPTPKRVLIQGKSKEHQNGKVYLNPFAEIKQNTDSVEEMETDQPGSPEDVDSDANTLHLEILSECGSRSLKCSLSDTGELMANVSSESVPFSQEETVISMPADGESELLNHAQAISFPRPDKPVTLITVPTSSNGVVSQMLLKPQTVSNSIPNTATTTTTAPRLVTNISNPAQKLDGSGHKRTFQLAPITSSNGVQQKPLVSDKVKSEVVYFKPVQPQSISMSPAKLPLPRIVTAKSEPVVASKVNDPVVLKSVHLQNGMDNSKNNLSLVTARQSIALQVQRDMIKAQEEMQIPRAVSYPARNVQLMDSSTQTNLFSLLEAGRFIEMCFTSDTKDMRFGGNTMPAPTMQVTNLNKTSKDSATVPPIKRLVPVDSSGRVVLVGGSSKEPVNKKLKLDQSEMNTGNIFKLLCTPPNQMNHSNLDSSKENVKNIKMQCDNIIQQHNSALELNGVEAMVVDPSEILPNKNVIQKRASISKKMLVQTAYQDWKNCLTPDDEGNFPLHNAVLDEDLKQVKRQCYVLKARRETIDIRNAEKQTPLHLAVWVGCPDIVLALLQFGARPELVDIKGNNALHLGTEKTSNYHCLETILEECNCKSFINSLNHDGFGPLHLSALSGKCREVISLVKHEADINLRDGKSGRTALFHSVEARDSNMSRLLVKYGASASVTNFAGQTPLLATTDMSMLGDNAMASVIMSRNSLAQARGESNDSWKMFETEDR